MSNSYAKRILGGTGKLLGPASYSQFNRVVELIRGCLPQFAESVLKEGIKNENGLNRKLCRFVTNVSRNTGLPFCAQPESMEDEANGGSPTADIGVYLLSEDTSHDPPKITVFEGKRLTGRLERKRRREYVFGHERGGNHIACGGIERFKLAIHGRHFDRAGMIGYIQEETPPIWQERVNAWISELAGMEHDPIWTEEEHLTALKTDEQVTVCTSVVYRRDDEIHLTHLWIDLSRG